MGPQARSAGAWLDGWLQRLAEQGWAPGPRERLQVQALLARLAAAGELPADPAAMLGLIGPLLCGTREQQRRYARLLQDYVAEQLRPRTAGAGGDADLPESLSRDAETEALASRRRRRAALAAAAAAGLIALAVLVQWRIGVSTGGDTGDKGGGAGPVASAPAHAGSAAQRPATPTALGVNASVTWQVLPQPLPEPLLSAPAWSQPLRIALVTLGALAGLVLGLVLWRQRRRRMALQGTRSDAAVLHHLLYDPAPVSVAPHPVLVRAVGRSLRQRMAGDAQVLDLQGTLAATVRAHGALSPRWRAMQRMPEYLVLIDCRHAADHQAAYALALADALFRAGVSLQVYHFDASPAAGCWARGALGNADALTRRRIPLAELAARSQAMRLLVFGAADACINPASGEVQPWMAALAGFGARAWFTARPMADWGAAEEAADAAGFLVLPLQEAALQTLAGWLTAERLTLALDPDTPGALPADLRHAGLNWVTQADPPPEVQERLLRDLRRWLGGSRFQWLCACAIFPAVTPPLTLALGRHVVGEGRALALGLCALSSLPWFRWGRMPAWLRQALLEQLSATHREQLQAVVQQRLSDALGRGRGPALADVATRVNAWLRRGMGAAQDVVLADYLQHKDRLSRLAQRLPEALRRRLFRGGRGERGLRPALLAAPAALALAGLVALTPAWTLLVGQQALSSLPPLSALALPDPPAADVVDIAFVGEQLVRVRYADGAVRVGSLADGPRRKSLVIAADAGTAVRAYVDRHARIATTEREDGVARVDIEAASGDVLVRYARPQGPVAARLEIEPGQRARKAVFTPSGSRVVAVMASGEWRAWGLPRVEFDVVSCADPARPQWLLPADLEAVAPVARASRIEFEWMDAAVWRGMTSAEIPPAGEVRTGPVVGDGAAPAMSAVVDALAARVPSLGPVTVRPVPDAALSAVASGCAGPGAAATEQVPPPAVPDAGFADAPVPGLTPQQQAALTRRLDRMFGSDKGDRVAATQELLADGDAFSDAVTLAVSRALRILQPSRVPMSDARASGVVNTLELLQQALPATLNRQRGEIEKLLQCARGIGADTAKRAELLAARLQAAQDQRPRLYVRIAAVAQRAAVQAMLDSVPAGAFDVQPIEVRPGDPPARPELRAVGLSDRATARAEAAVRRLTLVGVAASPRQKKANNDIYVVWIDAGLCTTRQAPGCPEPPAASAAPESPPAAASAQPARASAPAVAVPPAAESPAAAPRTREQDAQNSFVAEVFSCASAPNRSGVTKGDSAEPPGAQALAVATTLKSMGFVVQRPAGSLNVTPTAPASVVVMGYPSHEATVNGVATALKAQGRAVQTVLTDIGKVAPSATAQQLKEAGYSLFGVEQRLLVVVCSAR